MENNGKGIFYGVIGVATLIVAIIGATFAYFAAGASNNTIAGETATVGLNLSVTKVSEDAAAGLIPQPYAGLDGANGAIVGNGGRSCIDANGNSVCQVYKIVVSTDSDSTLIVDGTLTLEAAGLNDLKWAIITANGSDDPTGEITVGEAKEKGIKEIESSVSLTKTGPITKYIVIWLEEKGDQSSQMGQSFTGTVSYSAGDTTGVTSTFTGA